MRVVPRCDGSQLRLTKCGAWLRYSIRSQYQYGRTVLMFLQISDGEKSAAWLASKRRDDATANASARVVPRVVPLLIRLGSGESFDRARDLVNAWTEDGTRTRLAAEPLETCIDSVLGQGFRCFLLHLRRCVS
jgi:hypothetical protein